jgi:hypothetical protein
MGQPIDMARRISKARFKEPRSQTRFNTGGRAEDAIAIPKRAPTWEAARDRTTRVSTGDWTGTQRGNRRNNSTGNRRGIQLGEEWVNETRASAKSVSQWAVAGRVPSGEIGDSNWRLNGELVRGGLGREQDRRVRARFDGRSAGRRSRESILIGIRSGNRPTRIATNSRVPQEPKKQSSLHVGHPATDQSQDGFQRRDNRR